jgi:D-amino peptidase
MIVTSLSRCLCLAVLFAVAVGQQTLFAKEPLKIYIVTDLEGASGVYKFSQTRDKDSPLNVAACRYLMDDIAAVIRGLRDAGVEQIIVLDGHGNQTVIPDLMTPGATYITGTPRPELTPGLDATCSGMIMVGQHAMMGAPDGVLCHTQNSRGENHYWYNGVESGEIVQNAAIAGHHGVPTIMVTGDEATCREATKFLGPGCVTVAVKRGLAREAAELYPFEETHKSLYEGAKRAVAAIPQCKPFTMTMPIKAKKQWLLFDAENPKGKLMTKEGEITEVLRIYEF